MEVFFVPYLPMMSPHRAAPLCAAARGIRLGGVPSDPPTLHPHKRGMTGLGRIYINRRGRVPC